MSEITWKFEEFMIASARKKMLKGLVSSDGLWGVDHRCEECAEGMAVNHIPSGLRITRELLQLEIALEFCEKLSQNPDVWVAGTFGTPDSKDSARMGIAETALTEVCAA